MVLHRSVVGGCVALVLVASPRPQDSIQEGPIVRGERGEQLHDWLSRCEAFGLHAAVLVEQDGEVLLRHGYGLADRAGARPITWRTRFDIGSLGKLSPAG